MSDNLSWFQSILSDIQNEILVPTKLKEIKLGLTGLHPSQLKVLSSSLQLTILFDCLNSFDKKQTETTCDILKQLLGSLSSFDILQKYEVEVARALNHPEKCVKELVLHELSRCEDVYLLRFVLKKRSVLLDCFNLVKDEDLSVAQIAIALMTKIGLTDQGFEAVSSPPLVNEIMVCLNDPGKSVHALRVYQFLIDLCVKSEDKLRQLEQKGVLKGLLVLLNSDDILGKMAAIEELSKLGASPHGYHYLASHQSIRILTDQLISSKDNPICSLIYPGLLKFFGCVCLLHADEIHSQYPRVFDSIIEASFHSDVVISITALETVCFIGSTVRGKIVLNQLGDQCICNILEKMKEYIMKAQTDWKIRILHAVANLLQFETDTDAASRQQAEKLTEKWYTWLGGNQGTNYMFELAHNPFPEIKLAALMVITKLANLSWGQQQIATCSGALNFLLDRSTENTMEGMTAKYTIIEVLSDSPTTKDAFPPVDVASIQLYRRQGVAYVPSVLEIAVEGAD